LRSLWYTTIFYKQTSKERTFHGGEAKKNESRETCFLDRGRKEGTKEKGAFHQEERCNAKTIPKSKNSERTRKAQKKKRLMKPITWPTQMTLCKKIKRRPSKALVK